MEAVHELAGAKITPKKENAKDDIQNCLVPSAVVRPQNDEYHDNDNDQPKIKRSKYDSIVYMAQNDELLCDKFIIDFQTNWNSNNEWTANNVCLLKNPFKISIMQNFLKNPNSVDLLVKEMAQTQWIRKQMDLYEFYQTSDLCDTDLPFLKDFYCNLKTNIMPWMARLTNLNLTRVSASCSMYNCGDHLLVHDDLLNDRRIAYVFYLSPWSDATKWTPEMGGALELYSHDSNGLPINPIVKTLPPQNNQFIFFKVCNKSYHQVGEVTNFDYPRLTINGWFHGPKTEDGDTAATTTEEDDEHIQLPASVMNTLKGNNNKKSPVNVDIILNEWIPEIYLSQKAKHSIQQQIEGMSEASLELFLIPEFYELVKEQLISFTENDWILQGPANYRKYDLLCMDNINTGPIFDLIKLFTSAAMFELFFEYTELDLAGPKSSNPTCNIEIHRISSGCYSLLGDNSLYSDDSLDVIMFFNSTEHSQGVISYLNPESGGGGGGGGTMGAENGKLGNSSKFKLPMNLDDNDDVADDEETESNNDDAADDSVLLSITPRDNALNLVYRLNGTAKFLKYISKNCMATDNFIYLLMITYKE